MLDRWKRSRHRLFLMAQHLGIGVARWWPNWFIREYLIEVCVGRAMTHGSFREPKP